MIGNFPADFPIIGTGNPGFHHFAAQDQPFFQCLKTDWVQGAACSMGVAVAEDMGAFEAVLEHQLFVVEDVVNRAFRHNNSFV